MTQLQGPERGQEERLTKMIRLYEKNILHVCYLYLHDVELARDAVQDTFLKAYTHLDSQQEPEKEKSWLTAIAANVCRDYLRSAWVRHTDRFVRPEDLPVAVSPPGEERMLLTAAIMNLPSKYAEVIILRYVQGMDVKETAEALRITPSAVSRRASKACLRLRKEMEGDWFGEDGNED